MNAVETSRCPSCGAEPGVACKNGRTGLSMHGRPHKSRVKAHLRYVHAKRALNPWPFCANDGTCSCAKFHDDPTGCERRAERGIQPPTKEKDNEQA